MSSPPQIFISYSHDTPEHKLWVLKLAGDLRRNGVDAIIDQWNLSPGDDIATFMEQGLTSAERVIVVCSERYVQRANSSQGGVGYEKMIVTAELIENLGTKKFIPIVRNGGAPAVPIFLGYRLFIDFEEDSKYPSMLEALLREIFNVPDPGKPPIGKNPFEADGSGNVVIDGIEQTIPMVEAIPEETSVAVVTFPESSSIIQQLKKLISEPSHPMLLHDFVLPIADEARTQLESHEFQEYSTQPTQEEFTKRIMLADQATNLLEHVMAVGCHWADDEQSKVFAKAISRVTVIPEPTGTFYPTWVHVARYPILRVLHAAGIAAYSNGAFGVLRRLLIDTKMRSRKHDSESSLLLVLHDEAAFAQSCWKWLPGMEKHHFPASDYLEESLRGAFQCVFRDEEEFSLNFDRYEFLQAMIYGDLKVHDSFLGFWAPLGSFVWRRSELLGSFRKEIEQAGQNWGPLQAGFFSGSQERALEIITKLGDFVGQVRRQLGIW